VSRCNIKAVATYKPTGNCFRVLRVSATAFKGSAAAGRQNRGCRRFQLCSCMLSCPMLNAMPCYVLAKTHRANSIIDAHAKLQSICCAAGAQASMALTALLESVG
jgi:hypothetical protein